MKSFITLLSILATLVACSAAHATYLGNPLVSGSTDGDAPLVILGEWNPTAPGAASTLAFPVGGTVKNVQVWDNSASQNFSVYLMEPAGTSGGFQQFKVVDGQSFSTTAPGGGGVDTFPISGSGWTAQAGDVIGFWGIGPTYATGNHNDAGYQNVSNYTASPLTVGTTYTFGVNGSGANYTYFPDTNDPRVYSIGVNFQPVPEPSSLILCGLGAAGLLVAARRRRKA